METIKETSDSAQDETLLEFVPGSDKEGGEQPRDQDYMLSVINKRNEEVMEEEEIPWYKKPWHWTPRRRLCWCSFVLIVVVVSIILIWNAVHKKTVLEA